MSMSLTYAELKQYVRDVAGHGSDTFTDRQIARAIIGGLEKCSTEREWSWLKTKTKLATTVPYATGTVSVSIGGTSVTGSGTVFPSDVVGAVIRFAGERALYEISVRTSDTALTIVDAYRNSTAAALSGATYSIGYPYINLPANFRSILALVDLERNDPLMDLKQYQAEVYHANRADTSRPYAFAIRAKRNDSLKQLYLYPVPSTSIERYELVYYRRAGWFDSATAATSAFKSEPTADADVADWPIEHQRVLQAACHLTLLEETGRGNLNQAYMVYNDRLMKAAGDDDDLGGIALLGRGPRRTRRYETPDES
jgi:hypothetical protein